MGGGQSELEQKESVGIPSSSIQLEEQPQTSQTHDDEARPLGEAGNKDYGSNFHAKQVNSGLGSLKRCLYISGLKPEPSSQ